MRELQRQCLFNTKYVQHLRSGYDVPSYETRSATLRRGVWPSGLETFTRLDERHTL